MVMGDSCCLCDVCVVLGCENTEEPLGTPARWVISAEVQVPGDSERHKMTAFIDRKVHKEQYQ